MFSLAGPKDPGEHPRGRHRVGPRRTWRRGVLAAALVAAAAVATGVVVTVRMSNGPATKSAVSPERSPQLPSRPAVRARRVLEVLPAPYQLPGPVAREAAVQRNGKILLAVGRSTHGIAASGVYSLDPVTGRARPVRAALRAATPGVASVAVGRVTYRIEPSGAVVAVTSGQPARTVARLGEPVADPAVAMSGSRVMVFGGFARRRPTSLIQWADPASGQVGAAGHLPHPLAGATAFSLGGEIFVAGGLTPATRNSGGGAVARGGASGSAGTWLATSAGVLGFDPATGAVAAAGRLPVPVAYAAGTVIGETGFLLGGTDNGRAVPSVTELRMVPASSAIGALGLPGRSGAASDPSGGATGGDPSGTQANPGHPYPALPSTAPWLAPAKGPGHLQPGSDPSALPGDILIADHMNNRLLIIDPQGRIRWEFPRRGDLAPGQTFLQPDDAFFSPDGRYIIATQENNQVISVIDIAKHRIVYRYGHPGVAGARAGYLSNPDDAMLTPVPGAPGRGPRLGDIVAADIRNCRIVMIAPPAHHLLRHIGAAGYYGCAHHPPANFGSPNGAFPMTNGNYLVTEINGDWASEMSLTGHVAWSVHPPGVYYPSDTNEIAPGRYITADYSSTGQVVEFGAGGRLLWRFAGLNHPSLALPLPNGDFLVNDDYNDRVIVIDPVTHRIVWQYGHTGRAGSAPGYLNDPDGLDLAPPDSLLITHAATMGRP